jgi:hypothetical protein
MAEAITLIIGPHRIDGQEARWEPSHLAAGAGFEPASGFPRYQITQTQRPVIKESMDKNCCGLETGRQVLNPLLPDLRPGALSQLSYIRSRLRLVER